MRRPLVGVTGPDKGGLAAWLCTWLAIRRAGGKACRITPSRQHPVDIDALVLGGGSDVDPRHYGQERLELEESIREQKGERVWWRRWLNIGLFPLLWLLRLVLSTRQAPAVDHARDELELKMLGAALLRQIPVLGICRGAQLLNIGLGGSLHQELSAFYTEIPQVRTVFPRKEVLLEPDSRLAGILGATSARVNALHDQAVKTLGSDLRVVAREPSGVVQAIEHTRQPLALGVQWHPEFMPQIASQQNIFRALVRQAARQPGE
ncbi:gamma-glutamyl-gamma-aminobutyrate hydrolase family protein [Desulfocurvibacter africanus]|uniref:gamma-glutamyl-gamma-aminobutyrate hydrolase family protein n=1 Tax=Desulfocurvibacter africanus TaxID=873 RepID=UPI0003F80B5E|nr:gamma-glutamyl-gamma-aminobutyrate hydrolase family protein [Desulfocurvibacter africanus]